MVQWQNPIGLQLEQGPEQGPEQGLVVVVAHGQVDGARRQKKEPE